MFKVGDRVYFVQEGIPRFYRYPAIVDGEIHHISDDGKIFAVKYEEPYHCVKMSQSFSQDQIGLKKTDLREQFGRACADFRKKYLEEDI